MIEDQPSLRTPDIQLVPAVGGSIEADLVLRHDHFASAICRRPLCDFEWIP
jgi:hypothetical protein